MCLCHGIPNMTYIFYQFNWFISLLTFDIIDRWFILLSSFRLMSFCCVCWKKVSFLPFCFLLSSISVTELHLHLRPVPLNCWSEVTMATGGLSCYGSHCTASWKTSDQLQWSLMETSAHQKMTFKYLVDEHIPRQTYIKTWYWKVWGVIYDIWTVKT